MTDQTEPRFYPPDEVTRALMAAGKSTASAVFEAIPYASQKMTPDTFADFVARAPKNAHQPITAAARAIADARADAILEASHGRSMTGEEQTEFDSLVDQMNAGNGPRVTPQADDGSAWLASYLNARLTAVTGSNAGTRRDRHVRHDTPLTAEDRERNRASMCQALADEGIAAERDGSDISTSRTSMVEELKRIGIQPAR